MSILQAHEDPRCARGSINGARARGAFGELQRPLTAASRPVSKLGVNPGWGPVEQIDHSIAGSRIA